MTRNRSASGDRFSPIAIRELATAFQASRIFLTAYELRLFTVLGRGFRSSASVARSLHTDPRATDRLLNALCAIGLVVKEGNRFANSPAAAGYLREGEPGYMAGFLHTNSLWDTWSTLTTAVRQGKAVRRPGTNDRGAAWLGAFIAAMHDRAVKHAPGLVAMIGLEGVGKIMDVGGGSAAFSMAFLRAKKDLTVVLFDLPNVVPLARRYVRREGLTGRMSYISGDYLRDDLGAGYDLVFLSAILHSNSPAENRRLLKKCAAGLNPGGRVVVVDFIMDDDRVSPAHGAFFALNMLVGTDAGDTYTESEIRSWMKEAGLGTTARTDTPFGTSMITGRRSK